METLKKRVSASENISPELLQQNEQDLAEFKVSHNLRAEDVYQIAARWQGSVRDPPLPRGYREAITGYREDITDYLRSPFPYKFQSDLESSIVEDTSIKSGSLSIDSEIYSRPFENQFYKAMTRYAVSQEAMRIVHLVPFKDKDKHWDWARQFWHGDKDSSFLEFLQALEVRDYIFGFCTWNASLPTRPPQRVPEVFLDICDSMWPDRQDGAVMYPDLDDRRLDVPISLDGLLTRKGLSEDEKIKLLQAWFSFRENWPQTGRYTVWSLKSSDDAYARLRGWMESMNIR